MIPLKLHLKNFLSYGEQAQVIDFAPYPLICLSGKNGHGKSALLDAITWALWGQARKTIGTAKADQGLLRLGQTQMMVILDFIFNEQQYRVRREYMQTYGKPYAALDFGLLDPQTEAFISLTDKTIRDTQHKIDSLLRLDFESFINSAFLRQGHANEFSQKSPKERKEVLANILGLNQYEVIKKLATEKIKNATNEQHNVRILHEQACAELEKIPTLEAALLTTTTSLIRYAEEEKIITQRKLHLEQEKNTVLMQQKELAMLNFKWEQLDQQQQSALVKLRELVLTWRTVNKQQRSLPDQQALEQEKATHIAALKTYQSQQQKSLELREQFLKHKENTHLLEKQLADQRAIQLNTHKLAVEQLTLAQKSGLLSIKEAEQNLEQIKTEHTNAMAIMHKFDTEIAELSKDDDSSIHIREKQFEKRKEFYQRYAAYGNMLTTELTQLAHKQQLSLDDENPCCPLCDQNLSAARRRFLKTKFVKEEAHVQHGINRIARTLKKLKLILVEQHASLENIRKNKEKCSLLRVQRTEAHNTITRLMSAGLTYTHKISTLKNDAAALVQNIAHAHTVLMSAEQKPVQSPELTLALAQGKQLENELSALRYDPGAHQLQIHALEKVEKQLTQYAHTMKNVVQQQERATEISTQCMQLKTVKSTMQALKKQTENYALCASHLITLSEQEQKLQTHVLELQQAKGLLLQEKGRLEHQQEIMVKVGKSIAEQKILLKTFTETIEEYHIIANALGKDGIQALLIEDALPEIEHEANVLLGKLTNNQAHIVIESLRDLKKGGLKETLDIKISDAVGIRPYELFSGGEAFRIDFALRIAISKLLARRAGTSLQTLIIDEGFGSQDEEGLGHIMDALYKIQDDFAKIIIVSHLPSMKDQFPVHLVVEKGPQGSRVQVIEQG